MINEKTISDNLKNKTWLVSHGGVSSEYLTKHLNIKYPNFNVGKRPFEGCVVHFPYPVKEGPDLCIYIYGDIYNSIISQIPKHYDNPAKLHNDENYPKFYNLEDLLKYESDDPFGVDKQIKKFMRDKTEYPIILLKYPLIPNSLTLLEEVLDKKIECKFKDRKSKIDLLDTKIKEKLLLKYNKTTNLIQNIPDFIIRYPNSNYTLSQKDVIKYEVKYDFPGKRIKHFIKRKDIEIYNERDVGIRGYGGLRFKSGDEWVLKTFDELKTSHCGGVEDFRVIVLDNLYVVLNGLDFNNQRNMYIYDIGIDKLIKLWINNYDISSVRIQKNWTPFVKNNELYFIYSFGELCILKVVNLEKGECKVIKGSPHNHNDNFKYFGSTPLVQWNYPYYIGFTHTRRPWRAVPIIYDCEKMEIVKEGNPIIFENPKEAIPWRGKSVQFPYDLKIEDGKVILGIDFEDRCPTWVYLDYIGFCKQFSI